MADGKEERMLKRLFLTSFILLAGVTVLLAGTKTDCPRRMDTLRAMLAKVPAGNIVPNSPSIPSRKGNAPVFGGMTPFYQMNRLKNTASTKGDLVIGDDTPDESVTLTGNITFINIV